MKPTKDDNYFEYRHYDYDSSFTGVSLSKNLNNDACLDEILFLL
ncbi:hypothetical protein XBJ2_1810018 [Xenorhabdus bovienii str. Jollieti]|uniref:Uncharacterized protein n=1 Tax=Xenorhabdus bovienii (strain SS-2004) TaxID=406818 RepID=D3V4H2_XENBS|nr:hypothetical protein XBJ1_3433 [Xenorhabdus bovienii SS-2004]CDH28352.1 hypothetical protein XBJ2_1810018 [Xenorhabdus bovienii str. Jollieti]